MLSEYLQGWQEGREEFADDLTSELWNIEAETDDTEEFSALVQRAIEDLAAMPEPEGWVEDAE